MDRIVAIALGSNLGDRAAHLNYALRRLTSVAADLEYSAFFETAPEGVPEQQPPYLNAAAVGRSDRPASALLEVLHAIEHERGRARAYPNAARTLDLDLILCGDDVINDPFVTVPHPRFRDRWFVLAPLASIAPDLRDPVTGRTIVQLLRQLPPAPPAAHR